MTAAPGRPKQSRPVRDPLVDIPFEVRAHEHGTRIDVFVSRRVQRMSRSLVVRLIRGGRIRREPGGLVEKPSERVFEGNRIVMKRRPLVEEPWEHLPIPVIHEDARLLVVSKPGNLVVHPTASAYHRTLVRILRTRRNDEALDLAHRIDKETSGLVMLTRDPAAATSLARQFARRTVEKAYLAVVVGVPPADMFVLDAPLRLVPNSRTKCVMEVGGPGAQAALTVCRVLARGRQASLVHASPKTGRQHQIRVHLAHAGFPLLGDKLYLGSEQILIDALSGALSPEEVLGQVGHPRQALHAFGAAIEHPTSRARLELVAPLPDDLRQLCGRLGIRVPAEAEPPVSVVSEEAAA